MVEEVSHRRDGLRKQSVEAKKGHGSLGERGKEKSMCDFCENL